MIQISVEDAQRRLPELIAASQAGAEVIIVGPPDTQAVRLVPAGAPPIIHRKAGSARGKIWMADDFDAPLDDFREYME